MNTTPSPGSVVVSLAENVSLAEIVAVANGAPLRLAPDVLPALARAAEAAGRIADETPAYGRSTGVGANRTTEVTESAEHGARLVRSHATDAGGPLPPRTVRALIATRLSQLSRAGSGIDPAVCTALESALDHVDDIEIGDSGSIGTGDLAALSALALFLSGERSRGTRRRLVHWGVESALPFISSSALTVARAILATDELRRIDRAARVVFALTATALRANPSAWSTAAATAASAPQVGEVMTRIRTLVGDVSEPARIQDPYALRVHPLTQAALLTAVARLDEQLHRLLNAAQENPVYDIGAGTVTHHGSFFQAQLAIDLDATGLALAQAATNAHALLRLANEPAYTGRAPFLAAGPAGASGLMMLEYTAAAALADIRHAADPASRGTITLSRGTEEDATFATQGAVQLASAVASYRTVVACQLLASARLLTQLDVTVSPALTRAAELVRALQPDQSDQDLRGPLAAADAVLDALGASADEAGTASATDSTPA